MISWRITASATASYGDRNGQPKAYIPASLAGGKPFFFTHAAGPS